jgi:hypothetical protein
MFLQGRCNTNDRHTRDEREDMRLQDRIRLWADEGTDMAAAADLIDELSAALRPFAEAIIVKSTNEIVGIMREDIARARDALAAARGETPR